MTTIPWGEYKPDVSAYQAPNATQFVNNVYPRGDGYGPVSGLSVFTGALGAACRGAFLAFNTDGTPALFAGTAGKLYKLNASTLAWADVSKPATTYSLAGTDQWTFEQAGAVVIAVNQNDHPQAYTLGSSSTFDNLAGSPPNAAYVAAVNNFIVLSGLSSTPYQIAWSAQGDPTGWTAGTNQSGTNSFNDGGVVRGVAGGEYGWVFQDQAIRRMTFVGGSTVFQFDRLGDDIGVKSAYSVARCAERVFFLSAPGFYQLDPMGTLTPIGKERVDRTFYGEYDDTQGQLMFGVHDPNTTRVIWFYSKGGSTTLFNKALVYDWILDRWSRIDGISGECASSFAQPGLNMDSMDSIFPSIDAMTTSLDSIGGSSLSVKLGVFDSSHTGNLLGGSNLEATIDSPRFVQDQGYRQFINMVRPLTDSQTVKSSIFYKQNVGDADVQSAEADINVTGFCPHRIDGRITWLRNRIPAGTSWSYSIGTEPNIVRTGQR